MDHKTTKPTPQAAKVPRTKPAEIRLNELMTAAEKLFLAKGVEATTINEIVKEAQVAKGTFYHYFSSKNDMLVALGERYTADFLARLQKALDACPDHDWLQRLRTWIEVSVDVYAQTYRTHDIVYTNHHHHDRSNQARNALLDQLLDIIEGGQLAGTWRVEQPGKWPCVFIQGAHGATDDIIAAKANDRARFAHQVADACLRMLPPPEKTAR